MRLCCSNVDLECPPFMVTLPIITIVISGALSQSNAGKDVDEWRTHIYYLHVGQTCLTWLGILLTLFISLLQLDTSFTMYTDHSFHPISSLPWILDYFIPGFWALISFGLNDLVIRFFLFIALVDYETKHFFNAMQCQFVPPISTCLVLTIKNAFCYGVLHCICTIQKMQKPMGQS